MSNQAKAASYPSQITVSGQTAGVTDVDVVIHGLSHLYPKDIRMLVVAPTGQRVLLMHEVGGLTQVSNVTMTFDDAALGTVPEPIVSGSYKPSRTDESGGCAELRRGRRAAGAGARRSLRVDPRRLQRHRSERHLESLPGRRRGRWHRFHRHWMEPGDLARSTHSTWHRLDRQPAGLCAGRSSQEVQEEAPAPGRRSRGRAARRRSSLGPEEAKMIERIEEVPAGVIGLRASGKLTKDDYRNVSWSRRSRRRPTRARPGSSSCSRTSTAWSPEPGSRT